MLFFYFRVLCISGIYTNIQMPYSVFLKLWFICSEPIIVGSYKKDLRGERVFMHPGQQIFEFWSNVLFIIIFCFGLASPHIMLGLGVAGSIILPSDFAWVLVSNKHFWVLDYSLNLAGCATVGYIPFSGNKCFKWSRHKILSSFHFEIFSIGHGWLLYFIPCYGLNKMSSKTPKRWLQLRLVAVL